MKFANVWSDICYCRVCINYANTLPVLLYLNEYSMNLKNNAELSFQFKPLFRIKDYVEQPS